MESSTVFILEMIFQTQFPNSIRNLLAEKEDDKLLSMSMVLRKFHQKKLLIFAKSNGL